MCKSLVMCLSFMLTAANARAEEDLYLAVFAIFAMLYLKEPIKWNHLVSFGFIMLAVFFVYHKW